MSDHILPPPTSQDLFYYVTVSFFARVVLRWSGPVSVRHPPRRVSRYVTSVERISRSTFVRDPVPSSKVTEIRQEWGWTGTERRGKTKKRFDGSVVTSSYFDVP